MKTKSKEMKEITCPYCKKKIIMDWVCHECKNEIVYDIDENFIRSNPHIKTIYKEINNMKTIEIYLQDLTAEKQAEILETLGDNGNYDVFPIATLEFEDEEDC